MATQLYDPAARRRTVSVTLNSDLVTKASAAGINISRTAEAAVSEALRAAEAERMRAEIGEAMRLVDAYVAEHGMPFDDLEDHDGNPSHG